MEGWVALEKSLSAKANARLIGVLFGSAFFQFADPIWSRGQCTLGAGWLRYAFRANELPHWVNTVTPIAPAPFFPVQSELTLGEILRGPHFVEFGKALPDRAKRRVQPLSRHNAQSELLQ